MSDVISEISTGWKGYQPFIKLIEIEPFNEHCRIFYSLIYFQLV